MRQTAFGAMRMMPTGTAASQGNQPVSEFEELAMPLVNSVYNLARWLTRNDHDAEDLVQETYLKAFRNFRSFKLGTNLRAWLYRILRNTFLNSRTGLTAASTVSLDSDEEGSDLAVESETPETILMKHVNSEQVQRAIDDLPHVYRETLLLCDVEKMSYREISEILSIPIGTVMSRLARGRKALRDYLRGTPSIARRSTAQVGTNKTATCRSVNAGLDQSGVQGTESSDFRFNNVRHQAQTLSEK
jgi:RNA polymerase sigma factor (sigma-70 family)